jgi:hypothetical protein
MPHYAPESRLRAEIRRYQRTGEVSPELIRMLGRIIDGVQTRFWRQGIDEDVSQRCWLQVLRRLPLARTEGSSKIFGWLTMVCKHEVWQSHRAAARCWWHGQCWGSCDWVPSDREVAERRRATEVPTFVND